MVLLLVQLRALIRLSLLLSFPFPIEMRLSLGFAAAFAALVAATPLQQENSLEQRASNTACAEVSRSVATQTAAATPTVPAKVAWDCIQSVPLNKSAALNLLDSINPYIDWQSTTAYLKDPPEEYVEKIQPPVDIHAGLAKIRDNVANGGFKNEYEVSREHFISRSTLAFPTRLFLICPRNVFEFRRRQAPARISHTESVLFG